jgi:hypothetical protein
MAPIDQVSIVRSCSACSGEIETITVKKDNMMLSSTAPIWCPVCEEERPERRDISDRIDTIRDEQASYPPSHLAVPFGEPPVR